MTNFSKRVDHQAGNLIRKLRARAGTRRCTQDDYVAVLMDRPYFGEQVKVNIRVAWICTPNGIACGRASVWLNLRGIEVPEDELGHPEDLEDFYSEEKGLALIRERVKWRLDDLRHCDLIPSRNAARERRELTAASQAKPAKERAANRL